jgi:hypothetical protein
MKTLARAFFSYYTFYYYYVRLCTPMVGGRRIALVPLGSRGKTFPHHRGGVNATCFLPLGRGAERVEGRPPTAGFSLNPPVFDELLNVPGERIILGHTPRATTEKAAEVSVGYRVRTGPET